MLPFDREQFLGVFAAYNASLWPAVVVAYLLAGAALLALLSGHRHAHRIVLGALAVMWTWTGTAYHLAHFSAINPAARAFGIAFLIQAGLFVVRAVSAPVDVSRRPDFLRAGVGVFMVVYATIVYPLIGIALGHAPAEVPMFGVTPCPLTIFTFGVLLLVTALPPLWLLAIPLLWALVGGSAAVLLGIPQDWMLPLSAVAALVLVRPWQRRRGRA